MSRPRQLRPEDRLRAEHVAEAVDRLDAVAYRLLEGHDAAGTDAETLLPQANLDNLAAGMDERHAVPDQPLQDEALAAQQSRAQTPREGQLDARAERRS